MLTERVYGTMRLCHPSHQRTEHRPCDAALCDDLAADKLQSEDQLLAHRTVAQYAVRIRRYRRRDRAEEGVWYARLTSSLFRLLMLFVARFFYQRAQSILEVMAKLSYAFRRPYVL